MVSPTAGKPGRESNTTMTESQAQILAAFNALSTEEAYAMTKIIGDAMKRKNAAEHASVASPSGFAVGQWVRIKETATSNSAKSMQGGLFQITKVARARCWGNNPENLTPEGSQKDAAKQLWVKHEDLVAVDAPSDEVALKRGYVVA